ncbi:unnamed protein product, partial [Rotaria sordida]
IDSLGQVNDVIGGICCLLGLVGGIGRVSFIGTSSQSINRGSD